MILRGPVGLVLCGGGAWGAWQAGCLSRLIEKGLRFDQVLGFSIGAVHGAFHACGGIDPLLDLWKDVDELQSLRWAPRFFPPSFFSDAPLRRLLSPFKDDASVKARLSVPLEVLSVRREDGRRVCARFDPKGNPRWDGPLLEQLAASCSIPWIFPPVSVRSGEESSLLVDGGIFSAQPMSFLPLSACSTVLVLEMIRPDEMGLRPWGLFARRDQQSRELSRKHMDDGTASLRALPHPPRILRLHPSRKLEFSVLGFKTRCTRPALALGRTDADAFLDEISRQPAVG
ncbi:MAG: patatin-like phospholipase family protein [Elusimicrobiota bacterium]|jgi:NTE family protein